MYFATHEEWMKKEHTLDIDTLLARTDISESTKRDIIISHAEEMRVKYIESLMKKAFRALISRKANTMTTTKQVGQPS
jgi:hypothetical protein